MAFKNEEKENFCIEWTYTIISFSFKVGHCAGSNLRTWQSIRRIWMRPAIPSSTVFLLYNIFCWPRRATVVGSQSPQHTISPCRFAVFVPHWSAPSVSLLSTKQVIWIYKDIMIIKLILSVALLVLASNCLTLDSQAYFIMPGPNFSDKQGSVSVQIFPTSLFFRGCNRNSVNIEQFSPVFQIADPNSWSVSNQTVCEDDRDSSIRNLFNTVRRSVKVGNQLRLLDEKR